MQLIPVILCDAIESPLNASTCGEYPKPLIRLDDESDVMRKSILRGAMLPQVNNLITVIDRDRFYESKKVFASMSQSNQTMSFILEPFQRNTAAAIAAAALHITQFHHEDTLILVLAADSLNVDQDVFQKGVLAATQLALAGKLVTFGMLPYEANTKYDPKANQYNLLQFVKNASVQEMEKLLTTDRFLWNSNLFLFQAGAIIQAMHELCPDTLSATATCLKHSQYTEQESIHILDLDPRSFFSIPESCINKEVIKKSKQTVVVPCDLSWMNHPHLY